MSTELRLDAGLARRLVAQAQTAAPAAAIEITLEETHSPQIGRASCRERV